MDFMKELTKQSKGMVSKLYFSRRNKIIEHDICEEISYIVKLNMLVINFKTYQYIGSKHIIYI